MSRERVRLSPIVLGALCLSIGYVLVQLTFLIAWIAKKQVAAESLLDLFAFTFPINLLAGFWLPALVVPVAAWAANRTAWPTRFFVVLAMVIPAALWTVGLVGFALIPAPVGPDSPISLGRSVEYHGAVIAETLTIGFGCGLIAALHVLLTRFFAMLDRRLTR